MSSKILFRTVAALATAGLLSVAPAQADSVDGSPMHRTDRHPPASVRGSPSILFEDRGVIGPFSNCVTGDADGRMRSCSAEGVF
jgi:hypothetical protein